MWMCEGMDPLTSEARKKASAHTMGSVLLNTVINFFKILKLL